MSKRNNEEIQCLTVNEFAQRVGYSERHIRRLIKDGGVQAFRSEGRRKWLIPQSEVSRIRGEPSVIPEEEILQKRTHKEVSPVIAKRMEQHFDHLADITKALLSGNLDNVTVKSTKTGDQFDIFEYILWEGGAGQSITRKQLSDMLERNIESLSEQPDGAYDLTCFISHLAAEYPDVISKGLDSTVEENPYELIDILRLLVKRKTFKGTCPVCKD
jgi:excisionase family DNA binding protein